MSASVFTLLVMNPAQSALREQWDLFNEYLREFRDALPLIVLSCADQDKNGNEALRRKLLEDPELLLSPDQVLTRGDYEGSSEVAKNQRDALVSAVHERWASSHSSRSVQIERMKKAIRRARAGFQFPNRLFDHRIPTLISLGLQTLPNPFGRMALFFRQGLVLLENLFDSP